MKISDIVNDKIDRLPTDYVFTINDFNIEVTQGEAVRKHLNRLATSGRIIRLAKGRYYKAAQSPFGALPASGYQVVKDLLESDGKQIGYITGYRAFNELHLTTQVPNVIHIGVNTPRKQIERGTYKIKFILQKNIITKDNVPHLKLLDAIRYIKRIPDATVDGSILILVGILKQKAEGEIKEMIRLAMKYPAATRALLGAILEQIYSSEISAPLKKSLSVVSRYNIGVSEEILPNRQNWKIL